MRIYKQKIQVAEETPFDNSTNDFESDNVQAALEEVGASASPGFNFGRASNVTAGTWLQTVGSVPSNKAGITVALTGPQLASIYVANELVSTFDVEVYEHEGDEVNLTLLDTVSVVSSRSATFTSNVAITSGRQLAVKVSSGSARNINVGLQLKGQA